MITKIVLQNFRKYTDQEFKIDSPIVIIYAPNASGKTTILEAISILTDGESGWTAQIDDLYQQSDESKKPHFRLSADINVEDEDREYAMYQSPTEKRYIIDNHKTTKKKYLENVASTIFSPEHIELLMISPQKRREYLDKTIGRIDLDYQDSITQLRKILRQRNAYLKRLAKRFYETGFIPEQDQQLDHWTDKLTTLSGKIVKSRAAFIDRLKTDTFQLHYVPSLELGEFDTMAPPEQLAELHTDQLLRNRKREVALGHTVIGPHRDDWSIYTNSEIKRFGSRGEKRMAVSKLIFLTQEILAQELGQYPYLLLDDISSELDIENTSKILTDEIIGKQQVFITTVTLEGFPEKFIKKSQVITL